MRSVILGLSVCLLSACATVSMVPGETTVETGLSSQQSDLRLASAEYCDNAVDAGWVTKGAGLFGLADTLLNGRDETKATPLDYAARIQADANAPEAVVTRIVADASEARSGLSAVTFEARSVLAGEAGKATRADVMSFERALVRAQSSRKAFAKAVTIAAERGADVSEADAALAELASEIDSARKVADGLAERYASLSMATS